MHILYIHLYMYTCVDCIIGINWIVILQSQIDQFFLTKHSEWIHMCIKNSNTLFICGIAKYKFLRDVIFKVFAVNWPSMNFSSLKFHW